MPPRARSGQSQDEAIRTYGESISAAHPVKGNVKQLIMTRFESTSDRGEDEIHLKGVQKDLSSAKDVQDVSSDVVYSSG